MKQTISYDGYTIGDKVWVWAYWCRYLAEVEIIGLEIRRELNEANGYISYTVNIEEDGEIRQHTFDGTEFFVTRKELWRLPLSSRRLMFPSGNKRPIRARIPLTG